MENLNIDTAAIMSTLQTQGVELGLNLLGAIAIFVIGRIVIKLIIKAVRKLMQRINLDVMLQRFLTNILSVLLTLVVILAAVGQLGVEMTSLVAILGAAGLAVGLALQGSLANFAAGVLIVFFRPYRAGDYIEAAGTAGTVESVTIFNTILNTPDNRRVIVPNGNVTSSAITNFSAHEKRRIDLVIGVSYDDDLQKTAEVLNAVVSAEEGVLEEPAPIIAVHELADSSVNFVVRPWVATADYWKIRWSLLGKIKMRLDEEGITIPYPQRDVHLFNETKSG